ncbi:11518_t:CDS:2, partial [Racocetra persica]
LKMTEAQCLNHYVSDYYMNYTLHSEKDFGLVLFFESSMTDVLLEVNNNILLVVESVDNSISEINSSDSKSKDSLLKEIYSKQTFTSFDILEQYLKHYSVQIGFETKIVRAKKKMMFGLVKYTNISMENYNHKLNDSELIKQFASSLCKLLTNIKEEICFYVQKYQLEVTVLK